MENANNKRLSALRNCGAEKILEAYQWVKGHCDEFKREVFGPVLLEVSFLKGGKCQLFVYTVVSFCNIVGTANPG